jgi:hypothetical protein
MVNILSPEPWAGRISSSCSLSYCTSLFLSSTQKLINRISTTCPSGNGKKTDLLDRFT